MYLDYCIVETPGSLQPPGQWRSQGGPRGPCPPKLWVNVFFLQRINVVTFFESEIGKNRRNWGNLSDFDLKQAGKKMYGHYPPPPQRTCSAYGVHGKFPLLPPPTESGRLRRSRKISATTPPPLKLAGFWRSRKIYRVTSAGWPPPKPKSWLRRCPRGFYMTSIKEHATVMLATPLWRATLHRSTPLLHVEWQAILCAVTEQSALWTLSTSHHMRFMDDRYIKVIEEWMACSDPRTAAN